jgi:hypothetical protein
MRRKKTMSDIERIMCDEYVIEARGVPAGHTWAAEYTVSKGGSIKIPWKRANIVEGLPTHRAAIDAAIDTAQADIANRRFEFPD